MIKLLKYASMNRWGEPGSDIIRPKEFRTKLASAKMLPDMADFWRAYDPEPDDYLYLLVNIMGASEYYGLNLNGDGFRDQVLRKYHKTFMMGHPYWLHDNDDVKKAFGKIIFSDYNNDMHRVENLVRLRRGDGYTQKIELKMDAGLFPEVSMGCFVAGTMVTMADFTRKPIEQIQVGDLVRTHLGNIKPVTAIHCRFYDGPIYRIESFNHDDIYCTEEHPFYVAGPEGPNWIHAKCLKVQDTIVDIAECGPGLANVISIMVTDSVRSMVYNFEVEDDNSYLVDGLAVHNCHVNFDVCLICQNKARTKQEYCDHVLKHMRKLWPIGDSDGRRVGVDNPDPTFFDNSFVDVPADPQSSVLAKVATYNADDAPYVLSIDAASGLFDKQAEDQIEASMEKPLDPTEDPENTPKVEYNEEARRVAKNLDECDEAIPKEALDRLSHYDPNTIVHTAAVLGIAIRPEEYGYLQAKRAGLESMGQAILMHGANRTPIKMNKISYRLDFNNEVAAILADSVQKRSFFPSSFEARRINSPVKTARVNMPSQWREQYSNVVGDVAGLLANDPSIFYKTAWVHAFIKTAASKHTTNEEAMRREASLVVEMLNGAFGIESK